MFQLFIVCMWHAMSHVKERCRHNTAQAISYSKEHLHDDVRHSLAKMTTTSRWLVSAEMTDKANPRTEWPVAVRAGDGWGLAGWGGGTCSTLAKLTFLLGFHDVARLILFDIALDWVAPVGAFIDFGVKQWAVENIWNSFMQVSLHSWKPSFFGVVYFTKQITVHQYMSPWYDLRSWPGVKNQLSVMEVHRERRRRIYHKFMPQYLWNWTHYPRHTPRRETGIF